MEHFGNTIVIVVRYTIVGPIFSLNLLVHFFDSYFAMLTHDFQDI